MKIRSFFDVAGMKLLSMGRNNPSDLSGFRQRRAKKLEPVFVFQEQSSAVGAVHGKGEIAIFFIVSAQLTGCF